jgi:hypothetical protein
MTRIETALEQLASDGQWSPEWREVLARAGAAAGRKPHVSRRLVFALAGLVVAVVLPLGAVAATEGWWFFGTPAPPAVKQRFIAFNAAARRLTEAAAKRGFREKAPQAITSRAHGLLALKIPSGVIYVWAAPARGGGTCELFQVPSPRAASRFGFSLLSCDKAWPPPRKLVISTMGGAALPDGNLVLGRAFGATAVDVHLSNGTSLHLPVRESFYIGMIPKHVHPVQAASFDAHGKRIVTYLGHHAHWQALVNDYLDNDRIDGRYSCRDARTAVAKIKSFDAGRTNPHSGMSFPMQSFERYARSACR